MLGEQWALPVCLPVIVATSMARRVLPQCPVKSLVVCKARLGNVCLRVVQEKAGLQT